MSSVCSGPGKGRQGFQGTPCGPAGRHPGPCHLGRARSEEPRSEEAEVGRPSPSLMPWAGEAESGRAGAAGVGNGEKQ